MLDFFAGSGTTADAVQNLNQKDGGTRKFILVQLPEPTGRTDYPTIADVCKERARRVVEKLNDEEAAKLDMDGGAKPDRGFRVFKLDQSNFTTWDAGIKHEPETLGRQLELHVEHIRGGRTDNDILYELLLKSGYALTAPVEKQTLAGKTVYDVAGGLFIICLERELTLDLIRAIAERKPERVVLLDEGFAGNDQLKANAVQTLRPKASPVSRRCRTLGAEGRRTTNEQGTRYENRVDSLKLQDVPRCPPSRPAGLLRRGRGQRLGQVNAVRRVRIPPRLPERKRAAGP